MSERANFNDLEIALRQFWGQFTTAQGQLIPAFLEGYAPTQATFPYITFTVQRNSWNSETITIANIWTEFGGIIPPTGVGITGTLNHITTQLEVKVQEGIGSRIEVGESGFLWLKRNGSFIQLFPRDPDNQRLVRGVVTLTVHSLVV